MAEYKTVRLHESTWVKLKQRALDERTSLVELIEELAASEGPRRSAVATAVVEPKPVKSSKAEQVVRRAGYCQGCGHVVGKHEHFRCVVEGCECGGFKS